MGGAVAVRCLEGISHVALCREGQPVGGDGRTGDVAAQPLQLSPLVGLCCDTGMQGEAGGPGQLSALAVFLAWRDGLQGERLAPGVGCPAMTSSPPSLPPSHSLPRRRADDGDSCPIVTPRYEPYQGYLGPAPEGIDAPAAWTVPGGLGSNVWFADIEGGWNVNHEDLPGDRIEHVSGRPMRDRGWIAHGTAVLGEVAGFNNAYPGPGGSMHR